MTSLGLMAIFRNEADVLKEFIDHHISQGIDQFYLINNASEDNFEEVLKEYDCITLLQEPYVANLDRFTEIGPQPKVYNTMLPTVKTEWLYICDLDEYIYGPSGYTLKSYITEHGSSFDQLLISSKTFTSNGHIKQPSSVIKGFTERIANETYAFTNGCIRTNKIDSLDITAHVLTDGITTNPKQNIKSDKLCVSFKQNTFNNLKIFRERKDDAIYDDPLVINHYTTMSKERYFALKPKRGNASWEGGKLTLEQFYQENWDRYHSRKLCQDTELKEIVDKGY